MTQRPEEQEAVCTTIVGGRPPGCGTKVGDVPRGIEILVKKASVDLEFKRILIDERSAAAQAIELELAPAEATMLDAIPAKQLEIIIGRTTVPDEQKPAFLGKIAATMLLALTVGLSGCNPMGPQVTGIRPEEKRQIENEQTDSEKPDKPDGQENPIPPTKGIRPDRPAKTGIQPDRPEPRK